MQAASVIQQQTVVEAADEPAAKRQRFDSAVSAPTAVNPTSSAPVDLSQSWTPASTAGEPSSVALNMQQPTAVPGSVHSGSVLVSSIPSTIAPSYIANPLGATQPQQLAPHSWGAPGVDTGELDGSTGLAENLYFGPKSRWRKYGEKQPAGREGVLKTYFRCTHPGCPAKRTVTRQPGQAMEDGSVEMVTAHSHTELEYLTALADGIPRQHQRFRGENEVDSGDNQLPVGLDERGMPLEEDIGSMPTVPVAVSTKIKQDVDEVVHVRPPTAPHGAAQMQQISLMQGGVGSLQEVVLVVKAFDHECVIYPLGREQIERVARTAGARVMKNLSKSVTHVLVTSAQMGDSVYQSAYAGYTMVDEEWLRAAVGNGSQGGALDGGTVRAAQLPSATAGQGALPIGSQGIAPGGHSSEAIVAWCPICHKGFTTSQGMGGHYGRCKASFLAEQQQTNPASAGTAGVHPSIAAGRSNVGFYVCPHGWLAADCAECKIGQDDGSFHSINVTVGGSDAENAAAAGEQNEDLATLFTDEFCVQLNNLVNSSVGVDP